MKKYAVFVLVTIILFGFSGCRSSEITKPAATPDEFVKQYISMMQKGTTDKITDVEGYNQIIKVFGQDAWDHAAYTINEGNCPETREGFVMKSSGVEITEEEAKNAIEDYWEKAARDHNTTKEKITLSSDETYTEDEWNQICLLYLDYIDKEPAVPASFPLYDHAKITFSFKGRHKDSEENSDYSIRVSNKSGYWELTEPLSWNTGAFEPIDEFSIRYGDCLYTLRDKQDVIGRQPLDLNILSSEETVLGYSADTYAGCHEMITRYQGFTIKTFRDMAVDAWHTLMEMEVSAPGFFTYREIQVGDSLQYLMEKYPELDHPEWMPNSYIMDDGGAQGIQFIVSDNVVQKIIIKAGLDGPPYFDDNTLL